MEEISVLIINGKEYQLTPVPSSEMAKAVADMNTAKATVTSVGNRVHSEYTEVNAKAAQVESDAYRAETAREAAEEAAYQAKNILNELGITGAYHGEYEVIE